MRWSAVHLILASVWLAGQVGAIRAVVVDGNDNGTVSLRISGANPCGAVNIDYGDGQVITHPLANLPATVNHRYARTGDYAIVARGMGNCEGATSLNIRTFVSQPAPAPVPPEPQSSGRGLARGRGRANDADLRFPDMDRNDDGVITRDEWQGSAESFRVHDWNRDGVLSAAEIRVGEARPEGDRGNPGRGGMVPTWSRAVFQRLDRDSNSRLTFDEWPYDFEAFHRADLNSDRVLTASEFLSTDIDDDRDDRFDDLDLNNDGFVDQTEWHGSQLAFARLDGNRDRRLSRREVVGEEPAGASGYSTPATVRSTVVWNDTGVAVRAGEEIVITSRGEIQLSARPGDRADAEGSINGRVNPRAPLPRALAGSLIARVGRSAPFAVTTGSQRVRMPQDGRLYLGVNDDTVADNRGQFEVTIRKLK